MVNGSYNIKLWIGRGVLSLVIRGQLHFQIVKGGSHQTLIFYCLQKAGLLVVL